jgi:hypothetical protein
MKHLQTYENFLNESKELELGVKYVNSKTDEEGFISTGGSDRPKDWKFLVDIKGKGKNSGKYGVESYPYLDVKKDLKPSKDQSKSGLSDYLNAAGRVWDNENQEPGSEVNEKKQELGLYVTGRTSNDNTKIGKWLAMSDFHAEWNARDGYWLFPADDESEYDELEKELDKAFAKNNIDARFEGIFESANINDPILVAYRAAKEDRKKSAAAQAELKKKRVYGKKREALENQLWDIAQDLKDAYVDRRTTYDDMEAEAGEKGNDWSDKDANRYGDMLNKIDSKIETLLQKRQELEIKLAY